MSSPIMGSPASAKRLYQYGSRAMKTGIQLTKPQPADSTCSMYHLVASSLPTGRKFTTISVFVSLSMPTMSAVAPDDLVIICDKYLPSPSWVIPRVTLTPVLGTSQNLSVLLGFVKIASAKSLPTLFLSMSMAATKLILILVY